MAKPLPCPSPPPLLLLLPFQEHAPQRRHSDYQHQLQLFQDGLQAQSEHLQPQRTQPLESHLFPSQLASDHYASPLYAPMHRLVRSEQLPQLQLGAEQEHQLRVNMQAQLQAMSNSLHNQHASHIQHSLHGQHSSQDQHSSCNQLTLHSQYDSHFQHDSHRQHSLYSQHSLHYYHTLQQPNSLSLQPPPADLEMADDPMLLIDGGDRFSVPLL